MARLRFLVLLLLAGLVGTTLGLGLDRILLGRPGLDQPWLLYAASQMLHGVRLDGQWLLETNPPFVVWFYSIPVILL